MRKTILLMMAAVVLAGCAKPTEEQRLAKFRGSMKYKTYRYASEKATALAVAEYNKRATRPATATTVHATLSLLWFVAEKSEYSFVEADIAAASTNDIKIFRLALQSIALSKMKYPSLAKAYYEELKAAWAMRDGIDANTLELEHKAVLLSLIAVGLHQGDWAMATFGADALGSISQLDYLPPLVGAIVEARKGNTIKAVLQLRELNKSARFAEHKKVLLAEMADIIAQSPDQKNLGEELTNRVLIELVRRVLDDVFSVENQRALLEKAKTLPDLITGKTTVQPTSPGDVAPRAAPEK